MKLDVECKWTFDVTTDDNNTSSICINNMIQGCKLILTILNYAMMNPTRNYVKFGSIDRVLHRNKIRL